MLLLKSELFDFLRQIFVLVFLLDALSKDKLFFLLLFLLKDFFGRSQRLEIDCELFALDVQAV